MIDLCKKVVNTKSIQWVSRLKLQSSRHLVQRRGCEIFKLIWFGLQNKLNLVVRNFKYVHPKITFSSQDRPFLLVIHFYFWHTLVHTSAKSFSYIELLTKKIFFIHSYWILNTEFIFKSPCTSQIIMHTAIQLSKNVFHLLF